jgi:serine/threonine protein phosphatase PrpC
MRHQEWNSCGATCIGPAHVAKDLPNQDSWRQFAGKFGLGVVVCDGIGSLPNADVGSREACAAVAQAVAVWHAHPDATRDHLIRLIHLYWAMKVEAVGQQNCATTCLFAVTQPEQGMLVGQLGDGGVLIEAADGGVSTLAPLTDKSRGTTGLGVATKMSEWTIRRLAADECRLVVLATDGVFDDLDFDHLPNFIGFLRKNVLSRRPRERWQGLYQKLKHWPTALHSDDKTIGVLWRSKTVPPAARRKPRWKRR